MRFQAFPLMAAILLAAAAGCDQVASSTGKQNSPQPPGAQIQGEAAEPGQPVREEAGVGVGKKGHYGPGIVTTPVDAYFRTQERVVFDIQIKQAMDIFKALNNRPPESHEEFMRKIVKENRIKLPELPEGSKYVYDPEQAKLMVEHPPK